MLVAARFTLPVAVIPWPEMRGRITVVVKLSYEVKADGSVELAARPDPLTPDTSSPAGVLLFPSDFARSKSRCDVLIVGRALTLPPSATKLKALGMAKAADHVAAFGPIAVRAAETPNVQHAAMDQRVPHPRLPFRLRYEREGMLLDAIIPGPTPQVAIFRRKSLELQQPAIDTIAIDPERRRVMVSLRALVERVDPREPQMLVVDDLGGLPAAAAEIGTWKRTEVFVVSSPPASAREPTSTPRAAPRPIDDEVTTAFQLPVIDDDELEHTVTEMGQTPALAELAAKTIFAAPASVAFEGPGADHSVFAEKEVDTAPIVLGPAVRHAAKTAGFDRAKATTLPMPVSRPPQETLPNHPTPTETALPVQVSPPPKRPPADGVRATRPHDRDEVTALDALANIAPALPFVAKYGRPATEPPPASATPPTTPPIGPPTEPPGEGLTEDTVDIVGAFGRETVLTADFPRIHPLPFSGAAEQRPRPIPAGVQPATPFERSAGTGDRPTPPPASPGPMQSGVPFAAAQQPKPVSPSAPTTSGTPFVAAVPLASGTPFVPPPQPAPSSLVQTGRFGVVAGGNVGFDLKPVVQAAPTSALSTPSISLDVFAKIKAELWAQKEPRRDILKRHGVSELKWRMIERTLSDQLAERKGDDQKVGGMLKGLAAEVSRASAAEPAAAR